MHSKILRFGLPLGFVLLAACSGDGTSGTSGSGGSGAQSGSSTTATSSTAGTGGTGGTGGAVSSSNSTAASSTGTGGMAAFALTSTGFTEGAAIPDKYSCKGLNVSPDLGWTAGPGGTQSYAIVFTDKSNSLIHWAIWDIPSSTLSLPEDMETTANPTTPAGSKQVKSYDNQTFGYLGPCPPNMHTYEFVVYAVDVATLPNVTTASTRPQVAAEILKHDLASAALSGTFTP